MSQFIDVDATEGLGASMAASRGGSVRNRANRWTTVLITMAVAPVLVSCQQTGPRGSEPSDAPLATAPTATPTLAPVEVAQEAALVAYRGMWQAYVEASRIPDPDFPDLEQYAAGTALDLFVSGLESISRDGLAGRGEVVLDPQVTVVDPKDEPERVEIIDCVDTSDTELYSVSGEPYEDTPGGLRHAEATANDVGGGVWKVTGFALFGVGSCE